MCEDGGREFYERTIKVEVAFFIWSDVKRQKINRSLETGEYSNG